jgi:hypothetical protein
VARKLPYQNKHGQVAVLLKVSLLNIYMDMPVDRSVKVIGIGREADVSIMKVMYPSIVLNIRVHI